MRRVQASPKRKISAWHAPGFSSLSLQITGLTASIVKYGMGTYFRRSQVATTMIRVEEQVHKKLRDLAAHTGRSIEQVLAAAVEEYERRLFWEQINAEFSALRKDRGAWKRELAERAIWEMTLSDGVASGPQ